MMAELGFAIDFYLYFWYTDRMKQYNFPIIIEQDKDGYFAFCPELQGCYSQGDTYEEAVVNIEDAIRLNLQDKINEREEIPETKSVSLSTIYVTL